MDNREDLKIQEWELQIKKLQLKIDHGKNRRNARKAAEESPAAKYAEDFERMPSNKMAFGDDLTPLIKSVLKSAHEAGQAHATSATHEAYREMVERAKNAAVALREWKPMHIDGQLLVEALYRLTSID